MNSEIFTNPWLLLEAIVTLLFVFCCVVLFLTGRLRVDISMGKKQSAKRLSFNFESPEEASLYLGEPVKYLLVNDRYKEGYLVAIYMDGTLGISETKTIDPSAEFAFSVQYYLVEPKIPRYDMA